MGNIGNPVRVIEVEAPAEAPRVMPFTPSEPRPAREPEAPPVRLPVREPVGV